jgi:hypothetical protein
VTAALRAIEPLTGELRVIGTYPAATHTTAGAPMTAPADAAGGRAEAAG